MSRIAFFKSRIVSPSFPVRTARVSLIALVAVWTAMLGSHMLVPSLLPAQTPDVETLEDETLEEPLEEPLEAPPAGEPAPDGTGDTTARTRTALDTVRDAGVVGLLIVLLSTVSVGFIVEHFLTIRRTVLMPDQLLEELDALIRNGQLDEAIEVCDEPQGDCLVGHVVRSGLERHQSSEFGFAEYRAAVEESGEEQTARLYRKTEVLGLVGAIAPMLGLTGTVLGMINAFNKIASKDGKVSPHELAGPIGQALVTTLMGLVVAIPTMIAFSFFRNKIDSLVAEAGKRVEQIMMPLSRRGRS